jgi:hypothetical protein
MPVVAGRCSSKEVIASSPPAEAPIPTRGKEGEPAGPSSESDEGGVTWVLMVIQPFRRESFLSSLQRTTKTFDPFSLSQERWVNRHQETLLLLALYSRIRGMSSK